MCGELNEVPPVQERLLEAAARIEPVLEELLPRGRDDYLSEAVWYHMATGGKRIRPAICLLTCEQLGGDAEDAVYFAAAVEILHNMLLIHDDVEDGDTVRRDRATVWVRYGPENAINVGDYMLGVATEAVLRSPVSDRKRVRLMQAFATAYMDTCRGQAFDLNTRGTERLSVERYLEMVTLKTGRYMALGMLGGAIVADADQEVISLLEELGERMGAAFQIRDDTIDLTVGKGRGGVTGNDVREGKSSILYAHALNAARPEQRRTLTAIMRRPREETTDEDVRLVSELYEALGSPDFARAEADRLIEEGFQIIERIPLADREFFRELADYMVSRET
ncbi:MAG: polyprenyl synthetase family protein [Candidatus Brocadiaceae bacterium]|jgi:geranylgeranyl pyrophosphate synthase